MKELLWLAASRFGEAFLNLPRPRWSFELIFYMLSRLGDLDYDLNFFLESGTEGLAEAI